MFFQVKYDFSIAQNFLEFFKFNKSSFENFREIQKRAVGDHIFKHLIRVQKSDDFGLIVLVVVDRIEMVVEVVRADTLCAVCLKVNWDQNEFSIR